MTDDYLTPEQRLAERDDLEDSVDAKCFVDRFGGINLDNYPARKERKCQHEFVSTRFWNKAQCSTCEGSGVYRVWYGQREEASRCRKCNGKGFVYAPMRSRLAGEEGFVIRRCLRCHQELSNEPISADSETVGEGLDQTERGSAEDSDS